MVFALLVYTSNCVENETTVPDELESIEGDFVTQVINRRRRRAASCCRTACPPSNCPECGCDSRECC